MTEKKHKMKSGQKTVIYHVMGSWAGLAALTTWMKALVEQEGEGRKGR